MTRDRANEYLEDIRPTKLRLKQVEYLLHAPQEYTEIRGVNFDERVKTCTIGDNTANSAIARLDKISDLERERDELTSKLALYNTWVNSIEGELYKDLIKQLYIDGHSMEWIATTTGYEPSSIRTRKRRLLEQLADNQIFAVTQLDKVKER